MTYDPWSQANSALANLGDGFALAHQMRRQDAADLQTKRLADLQFADAQAKQDAAIQAASAPDLTTAYAKEMERQKNQQILEQKQKGFQTYLNTIGVLDKMPTLDPQTKTAIGKEFLRQNPEYAPMVDNLHFIDSKGVKAARSFGEGELKDPATGKPLPAGYYETEGMWTGDATNPVKLTSYKLASPPKVDHVPEGAAIPDGKGGYIVPAPKAEKAEKGFDTVDLGDKVKIVPRDGSPAYFEKKAAKPDTVIRMDNSNNKSKPTKPLPAGQLDSLSDQKKLLDNLREAKSLADEKDGKGNYVVDTGPFVGRAQSLAELGNMTSDKFVTYKQKLSTVNNIMLKLRSGAAVTTQEYERFLKEMPDENTPTKSRGVKLDAAINYATTLMEERVTNYDEGGYKVPAHLLSRGATSPGGGQQTVKPTRKSQPAKSRNASDYMSKW